MKNFHFLNLFLRISLAASFLSACADRFGLWPKANSVWGNWENFQNYTAKVNPWLPLSLIQPTAVIATALELLLALGLLVGIKTRIFALASGILLLLFCVAMIASSGSIKPPLDYSVFTAAAAAFALAHLESKKNISHTTY